MQWSDLYLHRPASATGAALVALLASAQANAQDVVSVAQPHSWSTYVGLGSVVLLFFSLLLKAAMSAEKPRRIGPSLFDPDGQPANREGELVA